MKGINLSPPGIASFIQQMVTFLRKTYLLGVCLVPEFIGWHVIDPCEMFSFLSIYLLLLKGIICDPTLNATDTELTPYIAVPTYNTSRNKSILKILWEKEKILVTCIFSFSYNVFYPIKEKFIIFIHSLYCIYIYVFILDTSKNFSCGK